jgi:cytochrome c oxidase cbb3-type subunit 3
MSGNMNLLVIILTVANVVGAVLLMLSMRHRGAGDSGPAAESTGHTWDGDLREYNNPLPRWWLWGFFISVGFSIAYLWLYPGFGAYTGNLGWSAAAQHDAAAQEAEKRAQQAMAAFAGRGVEDLRHDPAALAIGRNLFANNCALCHGADAHGNPGFPNLTDGDWLYGGDAATVETTITGGRTGVMIGWQPVLGDAGVENVLAYVLSLSGRPAAAGDATAGRALYETTCVACHGADGKGNPALGAPNLTDGTWLYGGSVDAVRESIAHGRQGVMPAQLPLLGEQRIRLLAAYVLSLGDHAAPTAQADGGG